MTTNDEVSAVTIRNGAIVSWCLVVAMGVFLFYILGDAFSTMLVTIVLFVLCILAMHMTGEWWRNVRARRSNHET